MSAHIPPLVTAARAAELMGVSRSTLWKRVTAGQVDVVYTADRKRMVPARAIVTPEGTSLGYPWTGGSLTRREFAEVLGISYDTVARAVVRCTIPVGDDRRIPAAWIASHTDPAIHREMVAITEIV